MARFCLFVHVGLAMALLVPACGDAPEDTPVGRYELDKTSLEALLARRPADTLPLDPGERRSLAELEAAMMADMNVDLQLAADGRWHLRGQGFGTPLALEGTWERSGEKLRLRVLREAGVPVRRTIDARYASGTLTFQPYRAAGGDYRFVRQ